MSASNKKKLRKEQNATVMAEKQKAAQKESRRLKISSAIFICVLVAIFVAGITVFVTNTINRSAIRERKTIALTFSDDHKLNSIMMSYYYIDTLETQMNNNSTMLMLEGLDFSKPLNEQKYEKDMTWADYFVNMAATRARDEYALCQAAKKAKFELPKDYEELLTNALTEKQLSAQLSYGFADLDAYLSAYYCNGANTKSYTEYLRTGLLAEAFYTAYGEGLEYTEEDRRAHDKDKEFQYSSYTYASYFISYTNFLPEGVTVTNATEEQKQAALDAAKAAADSLTVAITEEELDKLIAELSYNKDKETPPTSNKNSEIAYAGISGILQNWIADDARQEGDMTVIANESTTTDAEGNEKKNTSGYTVVRFKSSYDNENKLANVRHLLVSFEGGKYDSTTGITTYICGCGALKHTPNVINGIRGGGIYHIFILPPRNKVGGRGCPTQSIIAIIFIRVHFIGIIPTTGLVNAIHPIDSGINVVVC